MSDINRMAYLDAEHNFTIKKAAGNQNRTQIYIMDADGANVRQVTREGNNFGPAWSGFFN